MGPSLLSSLRSRIFLASALLAVLSIGVAIYLVNVRVMQEAERTLQRDIVSSNVALYHFTSNTVLVGSQIRF